MFSHQLTTSWQRLDRSTVLKLQGRKLHDYLRLCVLPFSAHYRAVFGKLGLDARDFRSVADLQKLPFTSKEDLVPTPEEPRRSLEFTLVPDTNVLRRRPSVILRALLRGKAAVQDELEREWRPIFMTSTTGRSSEPIAFLYTQRDIGNLGIGAGRVADVAGVRRDERLLNMLPFAPHLAFWYMHYGAMQNDIFSLSTGGGKVMGTDGNLRMIQKLHPNVIVGMPTFVYHVFQQAIEQGVRLEGLRLVILGGEKVAEGTRRKLAELCDQGGAPGATILGTYGFTECKLAFSECPFPSDGTPTGYHLFPDMGIVEVVDPETGKPVPDGQGGEIVWTPLEQRGTAVLRYRTGDQIENGLTYEACPCCGRRLPRLVGRISRVSDVRSMRFQKVKGTIVDFNDLERALDNVQGIGSWQIELRKAHDDPHDLDEMVLHVSMDGGGGEEPMRQRLNELVESQFELRPNRIVFSTAEQIRRLQGVGVALKEAKVVDNRPKDGGPSPPGREAGSSPRSAAAQPAASDA